jgi:hypothetical protein
MRGLFPLLGGLMLAAVFVYGLSQFLLPDWLQGQDGKNVTIFGLGAEGVVGIAGLLVGVVLMIVWYLVKPDFFKGKTLPRRSDDLVLAPGDGRIATFGLPDSGRMPDVIAPDFSNLPRGETAINAETGEEVSKPE